MTNCDNRLTTIEEYLGLQLVSEEPAYVHGACGPDCCHFPLSEEQADALYEAPGDTPDPLAEEGSEAVDAAFMTALGALTAVAGEDSTSDDLRVLAAETILNFVLAVNQD